QARPRAGIRERFIGKSCVSCCWINARSTPGGRATIRPDGCGSTILQASRSAETAMRWKRARRSDNVVDARGAGRGLRIGGGLGLGGIAIVVVLSLMMGQDPLQVLDQLGGQSGVPAGAQQSAPPPEDDPHSQFVRAV